MAVWSDAAISQGDLKRALDEAATETAAVRTAKRGRHTSIGEEGTRYHSGGGITVEDGGDIVILDGGNMFLRDQGSFVIEAGQFRAQYASGVAAVYVGPLVAGGLPAGTGLLVKQDGQVDGREPNIMSVTYHEGIAQVKFGEDQTADLDRFRVFTREARLEGVEDMVFSTEGQAFVGGADGTFIFPLTTGSPANVHMTPSGQIGLVSSSARYKRDIRDLEVDPDAVLRLRPRSWLPARVESEIPEWARRDGRPCTVVQDPDPDAERVVGFVAEELDQIGLGDFVDYDDSGRPDAIAYDRLTAALVPLVQRQQAQIDALTARLDAIEARLTQEDTDG